MNSTSIAIGIDVGGTSVKIGAIDKNSSLSFFDTISIPSINEPQKSLDFIVDYLDQNCSGFWKNIPIGFGMPGLVDFNTGKVHYLPNIDGWKDFQLFNYFSKFTDKVLVLDNDVNMMAFAEFTMGAARGYQNVLCITLGTGVGGGLILNGDVFRGNDNAAGEIGHIPVVLDGKPCNCGGTGCVETLVGNRAILQRAKDKLAKHPDSILFVDKDNLTLEMISEAAHRKDAFACSVWEETAGYLAAALTGVINLLNLDCIVIGGGIAEAGDFLFQYIEEIIKSRAMPVQSERLKIKKAELGLKAGVIGSGLMALNSVKRKGTS